MGLKINQWKPQNFAKEKSMSFNDATKILSSFKEKKPRAHSEWREFCFLLKFYHFSNNYTTYSVV